MRLISRDVSVRCARRSVTKERAPPEFEKIKQGGKGRRGGARPYERGASVYTKTRGAQWRVLRPHRY